MMFAAVSPVTFLTFRRAPYPAQPAQYAVAPFLVLQSGSVAGGIAEQHCQYGGRLGLHGAAVKGHYRPVGQFGDAGSAKRPLFVSPIEQPPLDRR